MSIDDLTQGPEAIATPEETGSVTNAEAEQGILDFATEFASEHLVPSDEEVAVKEPTASEEPALEETAEVDSTDDSPVEAEAETEDSFEPTDDNAEEFLVDYDDVKAASLPIKINGEVKYMKFGEIQNQLARAEAAANKSREATQQYEEVEALRQELDNRAAIIKRQEEVAEIPTAVSTRLAGINQLKNALDKALEANDAQNVSLLTARINKLQEETNQIQGEYNAVQAETRAQHLQDQKRILSQKGFQDVVSDNWVSYVKTNASEDALKAIDQDATLVILAEKARLWDESQSKGETRKLKRSTKTLKAGDGSIKKTQSAKKVASKQRLASGTATQAEAEAAILDLAKDLLA